MAEQGTLNPLVTGSNPVRVTYREAMPSNGVVGSLVRQVVTLVSWIAAPECLTVGQACELSGHHVGALESYR